jgi:hypothetical protein
MFHLLDSEQAEPRSCSRGAMSSICRDRAEAALTPVERCRMGGGGYSRA